MEIKIDSIKDVKNLLVVFSRKLVNMLNTLPSSKSKLFRCGGLLLRHSGITIFFTQRTVGLDNLLA